MSIRPAIAVVVLLGLAAGPTVGAQKGGKPKPVDTPAVATFRCNGPTAQTRVPRGTLCGPAAASGAPDAITGDGHGYAGVGGDWTSGTGAFLRTDGQLTLFLHTAAARMVFLNFERVLQPPGTGARKTFNFADVSDLEITTTVVDPATNGIAANGALSVPIGATWRSRVKVNWTDPYRVLYTIRFNENTYPGSTPAWLTRTSANAWTLWATDQDVARLVSTGTANRLLDEGWYVMPFEMTFTTP
jgi:hypothetical protein